MRRMTAAAVAAVLALCAVGCLPAMTLRTGRRIGADQVAAITPGASTKSELFERLGPPAAIVARGEVASIAAFPTWAAPFRNDTVERLDADVFYELFAPPRDGAEYERIYYYRHVESRKWGYYMLLALYENGETTQDRLWVLVDEKTGIVADYAFRKSGAATVFAARRSAVPR